MTLIVKTMELYGKVQKWIESITSDKLEIVALESKNLGDWDIDPKLNKLIFKALLCLSHTAERAKPSQIKLGKQIFDVTDNICYSLTEILDLMKYYSSLYHIARKLIAMQLYSEAMRVTAWSFPSDLVCNLTSQHLDMYPKIASLWHERGVDLMYSLPPIVPKADHKLLLEFVNNELRVLEIIARERSAFVLSKVIRYLIKLDSIDPDTKLGECYRQAVKNFLERIDIVLVGKAKYEVYHDILAFMNVATIRKITLESVENAPLALIESCEHVEAALCSDPELTSCLSIYKDMVLTLLKPIDKSVMIPHWGIDRIKKETLDIKQRFKDWSALSLNMRMSGYIAQSMYETWENSVSTGDKMFLNDHVLWEILGLIKLMFDVLNSIYANGCEYCRENGCRMEKNTHTVSVVSIRTLIILSKISDGDLVTNIFPLVRELLEENVAAIYEMKEAGCKQWSTLWGSCGVNIYNFTVNCHKNLYEETDFLFALLCSCIVRFEGINAVNSSINIKNPLCYVLYKLSSVHYNHKNYREALTPCALNGLLSYQNPDSTAFRMWATIKHACADSKSTLEMTMLSCLREDMDIISDIGVVIDLRDYDLSELCVRELRGLHEARCNLSLAMQSVLDELQILNSGGLEYAHGVNLLGSHVLHYQWDENFPKYLKRAARKLKDDKFAGDLHLLAAAGIDFYTFVTNLHTIAEQTKVEMETAKFALRATKSISYEGQQKNNDNVVPAYSKINISEDSKLFCNLQEALNKWSRCIESNIMDIIEDWHLVQMLRTLIVVGEYSRLHKFSTLETKAWELAYKVASHLEDVRTCVYVVGRIASQKNVNSQWINAGNELTTVMKSYSECEVDNTIVFFWVGLSNLYFEIGKHEEAAGILQRVMSLPEVGPLKNVQGYLSSINTMLENYRFCSNDNQRTNYMIYIVRCLYSMLALMEYTPQPRIGAKERQLYSAEVLLRCTAHLSLRMNSMLSFREISSHLVNRLKLSQASGVTLQVAECLKNMCFIDLSRMQLDNCIVKIQGLEFILQTEYIEESQNTKNPVVPMNEADKLGVRDIRVNDTSPVLRKTVFKLPEFIRHGDKCSCYKCSNVDYQYLVLSGSHVRAQLYFLLGHLDDARQHFSGAFLLRRKMITRIKTQREIERGEISAEKNSGRQHPWKDYYRTVEYVLLLLDFSRFIRELEFEDGIDVAVQAVNVCEIFLLHDHPIYIAAKELLLEYQFCEIFKDGDFAKFTVPDPSAIDITKFTQPVFFLDSCSIATPASKPCAVKPKTFRRNKTPPLLKLTKVSMVLSEDEDEEESESPKSSRQRTNSGKNYRRQKTLTRKKLQEYLEDPSGSEDTDEGGAAGVSRLTVPGESEKRQETIAEMITKAASAFPNLSKQLAELLDKRGISDSEKIQRVIKLVEEQGANSETKTEASDYGRRGRSKSYSKLSNRDSEDAVDKLIASFKEILIEAKNVPSCKTSLNDARFSRNGESSATLPSVSIHSLTTGFKELQVSNKKAKKRLDLSEFSSVDIEGTAKLPKPELTQNKERLRTSDRIRRSRSQSSETELKKSEDSNAGQNLERCESLGRKEKPKSSARRIASLQDISDSETEKNPQRVEQKPSRNLRRIEKSKLEMSSTASSSVDIIESSQFDDSDIIPSSDVEEQARNGALTRYNTRTSSRMVKSRSQMNGAVSKPKNRENSDSLSTSDPEESAERAKPRGRASGKAKKSEKRLDPDYNSPAKKDAAKKHINKRATSGRSKGRR